MKESTLNNIVFTLIVLLVAGALAMFYNSRSAKPAPQTTPSSSVGSSEESIPSGVYAELTYGPNNEVLNIPLDEDKIYDVDTGYYVIHLEVRDGKIRFFDSPCPDHQCEGFGWISHDLEFAACMPAHAVVMIQTAE